ncbi:hypothetical protein LUZ60_016046 [Juncus effusus]|nr:hypothetical protein LUZ60_016046 [Juncus effusus]
MTNSRSSSSPTMSGNRSSSSPAVQTLAGVNRKFVFVTKVALSMALVTNIYALIPGFFPSRKVSGLAVVLTVMAVLDLTICATINKCVNNIGASIIGGCIGYGAFLIGGKLGLTGQIPFLVSLVIIVSMFGLILKFTKVVSDQYDSGLSCLAIAVAAASFSTMPAHGLMEHLIKIKLILGLAIGVSVCLIVSIVIPVFANAIVRKYMIEYLDKLATFYKGLEEVCRDKDELKNIEGKEFLELPREVADSKGKYESMLNKVTYEPHDSLFWFPIDLYTELGDNLYRLADGYGRSLSLSLIDLSNDEAFALEWKQNSVLRKACLEMSSQSAKSLRCLSTAMKTMMNPPVSTKQTMSTAFNAAPEIEFIRMQMSHISSSHMGSCYSISSHFISSHLVSSQFVSSPYVFSHIVSPLIESFGVIEKLIRSVDELARVAGYCEPVNLDPFREEISGEEEKKEQPDHVAIDIDTVPVNPIVPSQPASNPQRVNSCLGLRNKG